MDRSEFGTWAMLAFWGSALGGIALAIGWAKAKGRNPATREQLKRSLKQRLDKGEIDPDEYERRMLALENGRRSQRK